MLIILILLTSSKIQPTQSQTLSWTSAIIFHKKKIQTNSSILFTIQVLIEQKRKIKRTFITARNPFLKSALNKISKQIKKDMKNCQSADIKKILVSTFNHPKNWRNLKKKWVTQVKEVLIWI